MNTNTFALSSSPTVASSKRSHHQGAFNEGLRSRSKCSAAKRMSQSANPKFHQQPLLYLSTRILALIHRAFQKEEKIDELDQILTDSCGYGTGNESTYRKQQELDVLCKKTSFTRKEIKLLYWGWKVACPDGILNETIFKEIYAQFFPQAGDSSLYAHFIFNAMFAETLTESGGQITFYQYAKALSNLCRGTMQDKIKWIFTLYDINKDGKIIYEEVLQISIAIYALLGFHVMPAHNAKTYEDHAKKVFQKLDINGTGYVTFDQFKDICLKDETIFKSMQQLDTSSI